MSTVLGKLVLRPIVAHPAWRPFTRYYASDSKSSSLSGSAKLFADAEAEDREAAELEKNKSTQVRMLEQKHQNWDGDESISDAVLRMLMDKYKPMRSGPIISADQKLKKNPPRLRAGDFSGVETSPFPTDANSSTQATYVAPASGSWATEPLLQAVEGHRPWHTEFKAPSLDTSSVKLARLPPLPLARPSPPKSTDDGRPLLDRQALKRTAHAGRLSKARESSIDYRIGLKSGSHGTSGSAPNPVSIKGWTGLIEDRIQQARIAGMFDNIKGRGKPLDEVVEEKNPFISREEFFMNRIVQRNGAAPPWVELQGDLDTAVSTFRQVLRQSWIRRVSRVFSTPELSPIASHVTLRDIKQYRDPEWVRSQESFHEAAVKEVNNLVRNYNGVAPFSVRRTYYERETEIERLYEDCAKEILEALGEQPDGPINRARSTSASAGQNGVQELPTLPSIFTVLWTWLIEFFARLFQRR